EVLRFYSIARALRPDIRIYVNIGHLLIQQEDWDGVIFVSRQAIELGSELEQPARAQAYNDLGVGLARKGDWPGAVAAYRKAIELEPNLVYAHGNLGNALRILGELDPALESCQRAIRLIPAVDGGNPLSTWPRQIREEVSLRYHSLGHVQFLRKEHAA